jgi:hypothetical protein
VTGFNIPTINQQVRHFDGAAKNLGENLGHPPFWVSLSQIGDVVTDG